MEDAPAVLATARDLAERISTPAFLLNTTGDIVFYNRAAELVIGTTFVDRSVLHASEWPVDLNVRTWDEEPFPLEAMPGWMKLQQQRPGLGRLRLTSLDGHERLIGLIANPLFSGESPGGVFEGAIVLFWTEEEPKAERRLATLVYTDIVGSTERAVAVGDSKWLGKLDAHDRLVRTAIVEHQGQLIKTTGDGALLTFEVPGRAIAFGGKLRETLRDRDLEIRVGIHSGEIEPRENGDIGGIAVHIASRVMDKALPGEILVSRTVTDLVAGSGLNFEERGDHELKGVPGRWQLYAVR